MDAAQESRGATKLRRSLLEKSGRAGKEIRRLGNVNILAFARRRWVTKGVREGDLLPPFSHYCSYFRKSIEKLRATEEQRATLRDMYQFSPNPDVAEVVFI
jgi:hypothetical protein